jgi:hypothetical protein
LSSSALAVAGTAFAGESSTLAQESLMPQWLGYIPLVFLCIFVLMIASYRRNWFGFRERWDGWFKAVSPAKKENGSGSASLNRAAGEELVVLASYRYPKFVEIISVFFFSIFIKPYWQRKGYRVRIIRGATREEFKKALVDPCIKNVAVLGHGRWNCWEATDHNVTELHIEDWMAGAAHKKKLFLAYTCGCPFEGDVRLAQRKLGYHAVELPAEGVKGTSEAIPLHWYLFQPGLFSLKELMTKKTSWASLLFSSPFLFIIGRLPILFSR